eukprot:scaffold1459_cov260-Pinguiococcus_pyrenoidosus.AAC.5
MRGAKRFKEDVLNTRIALPCAKEQGPEIRHRVDVVPLVDGLLPPERGHPGVRLRIPAAHVQTAGDIHRCCVACFGRLLQHLQGAAEALRRGPFFPEAFLQEDAMYPLPLTGEARYARLAYVLHQGF